MSIKLDWQVDTEHVRQRSSEDPLLRRQRYQRRLRFALLVVLIVAIICGSAAVLWYRLYTVDNALQKALLDTTRAEISALRIGDFTSYISLQRSPSTNWMKLQSSRFNAYQTLKLNNTIQWNDKTLQAVVDGPRGRVMLQEVRDGQPFQVIWFYWRYTDGWRHVPSDFTFWGAEDTLSARYTSITFNALDRELAMQLAPKIERWWADGCGYLACTQVPKLQVRIVADPYSRIHWQNEGEATANNDPQAFYTLIIPSPLATEEGTAINPLVSDTLLNDIANRLADRLVDTVTNALQPQPNADAAWFRQSVANWLASTFVGQSDPLSHGFIQSLHTNYGSGVLGTIMRALNADSDISIISTVLNQPLPSLAVDWRAFFQWRLEVEKTLLTKGDYDAFRSLWDVGNPEAQAGLQNRLNAVSSATPQIQQVTMGNGFDGTPIATVSATLDGQALNLLFRLVDGTWKRVR